MKKWLFKFSLFLLVCSALAVLAGLFFLPLIWSDKTTRKIDVPNQDPQSTITMKNITLREYEKGDSYEFVINAQAGTFNHISEKVECYDTKCTILQHDTYLGFLHAKRSLLDQLNKQLIFMGAFTATYKDLHIQGSDINYNYLNNTIATEKTITYTHPRFYLSANQSIMDIKAEKILMHNGVRSEFSYSSAANNRGN